MSAYTLGLLFSVLVLVSIFLKLRNAGMRERYAVWWIVISIILIIMSIFPGLLTWLAGVFGVVVPLNLAFFLAGVAMLLMSLQFSVDLSRKDEVERRLAEEVAILHLQVDILYEERVANCGSMLSEENRKGGTDEPGPQDDRETERE